METYRYDRILGMEKRSIDAEWVKAKDLIGVKLFLDHISGLVNSEFVKDETKDLFGKVYKEVYDAVNIPTYKD